MKEQLKPKMLCKILYGMCTNQELQITKDRTKLASKKRKLNKQYYSWKIVCLNAKLVGLMRGNHCTFVKTTEQLLVDVDMKILNCSPVCCNKNSACDKYINKSLLRRVITSKKSQKFTRPTTPSRPFLFVPMDSQLLPNSLSTPESNNQINWDSVLIWLAYSFFCTHPGRFLTLSNNELPSIIRSVSFIGLILPPAPFPVLTNAIQEDYLLHKNGPHKC